MSVAVLNNAATTNAYADATTVVFGRGRTGFSLQVFNAAVFYQLGTWTGRDVSWEYAEHYAAPSLNTFTNPRAEGFPEGSEFGGIRVRSAATNTPARVTVA